MAAVLIEDCQDITKVHAGIGEPSRAELTEALSACAAANVARNRIIHGAWATRPRAVIVTLQN
jgi:hypothetical protein